MNLTCKFTKRLDIAPLLYAFLYKTILEVVLFFFHDPVYSRGFSGTLISYSISCVLLIATYLASPNIKLRFESSIFWALVYVILIPLLCVDWMAKGFPLFSTVYSICMCLIGIILRWPSKKPLVKLPRNSIVEKRLIAISFATYVVVSGYLIIARGGLDLRAFSFANTYIIRSEFVSTVGLRYVKGWVTQAIGPFLLVYFLDKRKYLYALVVTLISSLLYLSYADKALIFTVALVVCAYYFSVRIGLNHKTYSLSLSSFAVISSAFYIILDSITPLSLFLHRMVSLPARISFMYYEFFSEREKMLFVETIFGRLLGHRSPYPTPIHQYVWAYYNNGQVSNANTAFLSDAYVQGGFIAMFVFSVIVALLFRFLARIQGLNRKIALPIILYYVYILANSSLTTTLLTHGLIIVIGLLLITGIDSSEATLGKA